MNPEKLAKLQSQVRIGGKGTPRRKVKKIVRSGGDDSKLQSYLQKVGTKPLPNVHEVNMFKDDGNVIHFPAPRVHADLKTKMFAVYGRSQEKGLTELLPNILQQMGPESLASLRKLAEAYQATQGGEGAQAGEDDDDDEIPELVENFDNAGIEEKEEVAATQ